MESTLQAIRRAIRDSKEIAFQYACDGTSHFEIVEPHQLEQTVSGDWQLGAMRTRMTGGESGENRFEFRVEGISNLMVLPQDGLFRRML